MNPTCLGKYTCSAGTFTWTYLTLDYCPYLAPADVSSLREPLSLSQVLQMAGLGLTEVYWVGLFIALNGPDYSVVTLYVTVVGEVRQILRIAPETSAAPNSDPLMIPMATGQNHLMQPCGWFD